MDFLRRGRTRSEFERFVANYTDDLLRTGYLMTADRAETEDLVQECLLQVARRWPHVRSMDRPDAYARRVLVNLALDGARRRRRRRDELGAPDGVRPERDADSTRTAAALDTNEDLLDALRVLPDRARAVLVLRYFGDFSEAQVADALGCSVGTVKSTASRSLVRVREALEAQGNSDPAPPTQGATRR